MTVYVDESKYKYRHMIMCHMIADTPEELHDMARKIGVDEKHYQIGSSPHYDICKTKRALAVKFGAREVSTKQIALISLERKQSGNMPEWIADMTRWGLKYYPGKGR